MVEEERRSGLRVWLLPGCRTLIASDGAGRAAAFCTRCLYDSSHGMISFAPDRSNDRNPVLSGVTQAWCFLLILFAPNSLLPDDHVHDISLILPKKPDLASKVLTYQWHGSLEREGNPHLSIGRVFTVLCNLFQDRHFVSFEGTSLKLKVPFSKRSRARPSIHRLRGALYPSN